MPTIIFYNLLINSSKTDSFTSKNIEKLYSSLIKRSSERGIELKKINNDFYEYLMLKVRNTTINKKQIENYYNNFINIDDDINDLVQITGKLSLENIKSMDDLIEKSHVKRWIKKIDFDNLLSIDKYEHKDNFIHVADVLLDNELDEKGHKRRQTLIRFNNIISTNDFSQDCEWIYLFTINNIIVKIGGTRNSLKGRVGSYLCGHHIPERKKSGDCSKTNGFIYNTFEFYLNNGYEIKMYGYKLPEVLHETTILNDKVKIKVQTYHAYESKFLDDFKNRYGKYPLLSDNADPNYKKS